MYEKDKLLLFLPYFENQKRYMETVTISTVQEKFLGVDVNVRTKIFCSGNAGWGHEICYILEFYGHYRVHTK